MAERKPPGATWTSHIEQQIERARAEGAFEDLPGAGKPIPDLRGPHDELWWLKGLLRREGLSVTPPTLELRRDVERVLARLPRIPGEARVRRLVGELNARIRRANATQTSGPASSLGLLDEEEVVAAWRVRRGS